MLLMQVVFNMSQRAFSSVQSSPRTLQFEAVFFDGKTAAEQHVSVEVAGDTLSVLNAKRDIIQSFDLGQMSCRLTSSDQYILSSIDQHDDCRIVVDDAALQPEILTQLNTIPGKPQHPIGQPIRFIFACVMFILACGISFAVLIPLASDQLVAFVPSSFEKTLGDRLESAVLRAGGQTVCESSENNSHLSVLAERLQATVETSVPVSLHVIDLPVANAFALPSARIFVTRPLIDLTASPDELIAVLAHEMGHVHAHHALRLSLRVGGTSALLGFLLGDFTGSAAIIAIGQTLIGTAHSREFEREADEVAAQILQSLGISPVVLAHMLERLDADAQNVGFLATHPHTPERRDFLQQFETAETNATRDDTDEILSIEGWKSLKLICG